MCQSNSSPWAEFQICLLQQVWEATNYNSLSQLLSSLLFGLRMSSKHGTSKEAANQNKYNPCSYALHANAASTTACCHPVR